MKPMPFQQRTIDATLRVLKRKSGVRRFLIADEVGLGKTVAAAGVIEHLSADGTKPLRVFYVAPGHTIARQNRDRLLPKAGCAPKHDRLGLLPYSVTPHRKVEVYALAPETSFHTRGTGRQDERLRLELLLQAAYAGLVLPQDLFSRGSGNWPAFRRAYGPSHQPTTKVIRTFKFWLCCELRVAPVQARSKLEGLAQNRSAFFTLLRKVLAVTLLQLHMPDIVVLDEFQRYRELLEPGGTSLFSTVLNPRAATQAPSVLLLSATPFKLPPTRKSDSQPSAEYENLYKLLGFLADDPKRVPVEAGRLFDKFRDTLSAYLNSDPSTQSERKARVEAAKSELEHFLKRFISRTERLQFGHVDTDSDTEKDELIALLDEDLAMYKHLATGFRHAREQKLTRGRGSHAGEAVAYWLSVPLAAQTLGKGYEAWRSSEQGLLAPPGPPSRITRARKKSIQGAVSSAKLRRLQALCPPEQLTLPWCAPSLPWWELGGPWKGMEEGAGQKLLLFSRFRATPGAVAGLMSLTAEPNRGKRRPRLRASGAVYAMFYPSLLLAEHVDPLQSYDRGLKAMRATAQQSLRKLFRELGITIAERNRKQRRKRRTIWDLLLSLEGRYADMFPCTHYRTMHSAWRDATGDDSLGLPVGTISRRELRELVDLALEGPGVVCGRTFLRHRRAIEAAGAEHEPLPDHAVVELSWNALRTYLDDPVFLNKSPTRSALQQIRDLIREGCLEAVLDEHLSHSLKNPKATLRNVAAELRDALQLSPGASSFHPVRSRRESKVKERHIIISCRAAVSFSSTERLDQSKAARPDELRKAFNTPFRPFLLASTSVGQEGLDFHVWCDRLVHWDLCSTPLDLEQREGRIQRFMSLSVRRALAGTFRSQVCGIQSGSPWRLIEHQVADSPQATVDGISPWWLVNGMKLRNHYFLLEQSRDIARSQLLRTQRMFYRFALGQPNPQEFVRDIARNVLSGQSGLQDLRKLMLDLSPTEK